MDSLAAVGVEEKETAVSNWQTTLDVPKAHTELGVAHRLAFGCFDLLRAQVKTLTSSESLSSNVQRKLIRALGLLKIWIEEAGVASGQLDRLLELSISLRQLVLTTIIDLANTLINRLSRVANSVASEQHEVLSSLTSGLGLVLEEAVYSIHSQEDSDSDSGSDPNHSDDGYTDVEKIVSDLVREALALQDLHPSLQHPLLQKLQAGVSNAPFSLSTLKASLPFEDRIASRFPAASKAIVECLGEANLARSIRSHQLRSIAEQGDSEGPTKSEAATSFRDSGLGSSAAPQTIVTTMSFYSPNGDCIRFPPLPPASNAGPGRVCGCCNKTLLGLTGPTWKRHLVQKLEPYTCFMSPCPSKGITFAARDRWVQHIATEHELAPDWLSLKCPLCAEIIKKGCASVSRHLSSHLEEIALAALPPSMYDQEVEEESMGTSSDRSSGQASPTADPPLSTTHLHTRKHTACDRCRARRIICAPSSSVDRACQTCHHGGLACHTSPPLKTDRTPHRTYRKRTPSEALESDHIHRDLDQDNVPAPSRGVAYTTVAPLQDWLDRNRNDPYPTWGMRATLAERTGLWIKQVDNWFTNARARRISSGDFTDSTSDVHPVRIATPENEQPRSDALETGSTLPPAAGSRSQLSEDHRNETQRVSAPLNQRLGAKRIGDGYGDPFGLSGFRWRSHRDEAALGERNILATDQTPEQESDFTERSTRDCVQFGVFIGHDRAYISEHGPIPELPQTSTSAWRGTSSARMPTHASTAYHARGRDATTPSGGRHSYSHNSYNSDSKLDPWKPDQKESEHAVMADSSSSKGPMRISSIVAPQPSATLPPPSPTPRCSVGSIVIHGSEAGDDLASTLFAYESGQKRFIFDVAKLTRKPGDLDWSDTLWTPEQAFERSFANSSDSELRKEPMQQAMDRWWQSRKATQEEKRRKEQEEERERWEAMQARDEPSTEKHKHELHMASSATIWDIMRIPPKGFEEDWRRYEEQEEAKSLARDRGRA